MYYILYFYNKVRYRENVIKKVRMLRKKKYIPVLNKSIYVGLDWSNMFKVNYI